jgi:GTPase
MQRTRNGRSAATVTPAVAAGNGYVEPARARQRAFCIAALPEGEDLSELAELLRTAGVAVVGEMVQRREQPHPNTYLGPGKVQEAKAAALAADANVIACDDELSARQERNLEEALGLPVVDRTTVILDIFASHAGSAEGKLQVELAQLEYNLARMRGLWSHLERLGGGIGTRGPGETQIETDRRLARDRISTLRKRLEHVKGTRAVQRAERERAALATVALVGYTNAGKSTLLNALTGSEVGVRDRLFHTLDPTTRTLKLGGRPVLMTDTVGFISKLPHQLVDAFAATLEETHRADLLAHVLDASAPEAHQEIMKRSVEETLEEIGAGERPRLLVLNKVDLLGQEERDELRLRHPDAVLVSAAGAAQSKDGMGEGLQELIERIEHELAHTLSPIELLVPYADGGSLAELHDLAGELRREDTPEGVRIHALVPTRMAARFARFAVVS